MAQPVPQASATSTLTPPPPTTHSPLATLGDQHYLLLESVQNSEDIFEVNNDVVKNRIDSIVFQYILKHYNVKSKIAKRKYND